MFNSKTVAVVLGGITIVLALAYYHQAGGTKSIWTDGAPSFKSYGYTPFGLPTDVPPMSTAQKTFTDRFKAAEHPCGIISPSSAANEGATGSPCAEWMRPELEAYAKNRIVPNVEAKSDKLEAGKPPVKAQGE